MHDSMDTTIPPLYAPWLRDIVGGPIPAETRATCDRCVMLPTEGSAPDAVFFSPITKCCTYQPTIPNFLAAAGLFLLGEEFAAQPDVTELEGPPDPRRYRDLWGTWEGREAEFYQACATLVEPLQLQIVDARDGKYWLISYSEHDPLVMPEQLVGVLSYFDGRPTEDALAAILAERNVRVDLSLVRRMVDFGILRA